MNNSKLIKKSIKNNLKEDFKIAIVNQIKNENANIRNWRLIFLTSLFISSFVLFRPFYLQRNYIIKS